MREWFRNRKDFSRLTVDELRSVSAYQDSHYTFPLETVNCLIWIFFFRETLPVASIWIALWFLHIWSTNFAYRRRHNARIELLRRDNTTRIEDVSDMLKWHQFWRRTPEIDQLLIQAMLDSQTLQIPLSTKLQIGANRFLKSLKKDDPLFEPTTRLLGR